MKLERNLDLTCLLFYNWCSWVKINLFGILHSLGFDNPQQIVHEHSRILLLNLIHSLVVNKLRQGIKTTYFSNIQHNLNNILKPCN